MEGAVARDNGYKDDQTDALLAAILRVPRRRCRRALVYWHVIHATLTAALVVAVVVLACEVGRLRRTVQSLRETIIRMAGHAEAQAAHDE